MRRIGFIVFVFLLASPCHAFKPQEQHDPISQQAISLYQSCTGRIIPNDLTEIFIQKVIAEDDKNLERLTNWHFYNNKGKIERYYLFFYGANDKTFQKLVEQLNGLLASPQPRKIELYKIAGRLAHHIQDMSTPPHVMPIYHVADDRFENYMPTHPPDVNPADFCKVLKEPVISPSDLLEEAAQNTLKAVAGPVVFDSVKNVEHETWMKFWGGADNPDLTGFKTYGEYGDVFGMLPPCRSDVCRLYDKDTYDRFFNECHMRAVRDTVRLLLFMDQVSRERR